MDRSKLVPGKFYWVYVNNDPDAQFPWENSFQPARFSGYAINGEEEWFYLNVEGTTDWAPQSVVAELHACGIAEIIQALKPVCTAIDINDGDTLSRMSKDDTEIWTASGSWTGSFTLTLGHLRMIANAVHAYTADQTTLPPTP